MIDVSCLLASSNCTKIDAFCFTDLRALESAAASRQRMAYRPGTYRNRKSHIKLFLAFCYHYGLPDLPTEPHTLILFTEFLLRSFVSPKSITNTLASVRFYHAFLDLPTQQFDNFQLNLTRRALPLTVRHVPQPAPACTLEILGQLGLALDGLGPRGCVIKALCYVAFFSLARLSSLLPDRLPFDTTRFPTLSDLFKLEDGLVLRLKHSKTTQLASQAFTVPLLRPGSSGPDPVQTLLSMLVLFGPRSPDTPLFLWPQPGAHPPFLGATPLCASTARGWLRLALQKANVSIPGFSFHSFRRGGCTLAAERGASFHDLQALGHWHSNAVRRYFPQLPSQLRAARCLSAT